MKNLLKAAFLGLVVAVSITACDFAKTNSTKVPVDSSKVTIDTSAKSIDTSKKAGAGAIKKDTIKKK